MEMSDKIGDLSAALAKAQGDMTGAEKSTTNPFYSSKYADLSSIAEACGSHLSENEIAHTQWIGSEGGAVTVTTMLSHSSGEWMRDTVGWIPEKNTAQGVGSLITYLRRYALAGAAGVAPKDDDDAEAAMGRPQNASTGSFQQVGTAAPEMSEAATYDAVVEQLRAASNTPTLDALAIQYKEFISSLDSTDQEAIKQIGKERRRELTENTNGV